VTLDRSACKAAFEDLGRLEGLTDVALPPAVEDNPAAATFFTRKANVAES
jgi:hypothetical protein